MTLSLKINKKKQKPTNTILLPYSKCYYNLGHEKQNIFPTYETSAIYSYSITIVVISIN